MHTLAGRARFPDPVDGRLFDVNAWYGRLAAANRLIAWHAKDADRIIPLPAPGTNPFTQTRTRPGFPLNGGVDVVYVGEGSISRGYPVDPDPEVLGYQDQFDRFELSSPGWFHAESDSGPGPAATDPGRSLRWAKVSARVPARPPRGRRREDCEDDDRHGRIAAVAAARAPAVATAILAIAAAGSAWAHGDPASHYLETDLFIRRSPASRRSRSSSGFWAAPGDGAARLSDQGRAGRGRGGPRRRPDEDQAAALRRVRGCDDPG